jgi:hypothetical protein
VLHAWIQGEIVQQYSQDSVFQEFFIRPPLVNPDTFLLNEHGETSWPGSLLFILSGPSVKQFKWQQTESS